MAAALPDGQPARAPPAEPLLARQTVQPALSHLSWRAGETTHCQTPRHPKRSTQGQGREANCLTACCHYGGAVASPLDKWRRGRRRSSTCSIQKEDPNHKRVENGRAPVVMASLACGLPGDKATPTDLGRPPSTLAPALYPRRDRGVGETPKPSGAGVKLDEDVQDVELLGYTWNR